MGYYNTGIGAARIDDSSASANTVYSGYKTQTCLNELSDTIALYYDATRTALNPYHSGDFCMYLGTLYHCVVPTTYGVWNPAAWQSVSLSTLVECLSDLSTYEFRAGNYIDGSGLFCISFPVSAAQGSIDCSGLNPDVVMVDFSNTFLKSTDGITIYPFYNSATDKFLIYYNHGDNTLNYDAVQDGSTALSGLITIRYTKREEES